jgi:cytidylate kinase
VNLPRQIAVDGPAGSGKSSVSFVVARDLGYLFVDTGAFYRALTLAAIEAELVDADEPTITALAERIHITITADLDDDERQYTVLLESRDVTWAIRDSAVEKHVSRVSAMPTVRDTINRQQRQLSEQQRVIMAGRDIGTVVLPDADLKLYLDASPEARAERRYRQATADGRSADLTAIQRDLERRDAHDSGRTVAPLRKADDAVYVNTDNLTMAGVIARIEEIIHAWQPTQPVQPPEDHQTGSLA